MTDNDDRENEEQSADEIQVEPSDTSDADALAEIVKARKWEAEMKAAHIEAREAAKEAKENWESAVSQLTATIDRVARPLPLFDQKKPTAEADGWKALPLTHLDLSPAVESYLAAAGFETMGALSDHMNAKKGFWARDLSVADQRKPRGFVDAVHQGYEDFFANHPEYVPGCDDGPANVLTRDGRRITAKQMMGEIGRNLSK